MPVELSMEASRAWNMRYLLELGENRPELLLFYGHRVTKAVTETCLSQWYPCQFEVDAIPYTSAEQYMMAEKAKLFGDEEIKVLISSKSASNCHIINNKINKVICVNITNILLISNLFL